MKRIYLFGLMICCLNGSAQQYHFNFLTNYVSTYKGKNSNNIGYVNSKDDAYFLRIHKYEGETIAYLFDLVREQMHSFAVLTVETVGDPIFKFTYKETEPRKMRSVFNRYPFNFTTIATDGDKQKLQLDVYKNNKKKTLFHHYKLSVQAYDQNMFHAFRYSCVHPMEFVRTLNTGEDCVVLEAEYTMTSGEILYHKLAALREVSLFLEISKR